MEGHFGAEPTFTGDVGDAESAIVYNLGTCSLCRLEKDFALAHVRVIRYGSQSMISFLCAARKVCI